MNRDFSNEMAECCALCEHSINLEFRGQFLCKYKNRISEVDPDDRCRNFEPDLLKLSPKPRKRIKLEL